MDQRDLQGCKGSAIDLARRGQPLGFLIAPQGAKDARWTCLRIWRCAMLPPCCTDLVDHCTIPCPVGLRGFGSFSYLGFQQQFDQLKSVLTACLALADKFAEGTIETVMGKSDIELAMDVLSGKLKR